MLPTKTPLFQLISARMGWLSQRQGILNQNIANADTPDYRPRDLRADDFERLAAGALGRPSGIPVDRTHDAHLDGAPVVRVGLTGQAHDSAFEVAPDGNEVILEEQMAKSAQTALDHQLASNLYRKYVGMVRIALGTQS